MKNIKRACAALLAAMLLSSMAYAAEPAVTFDFEKDDAGFTPVFADCPAEDGVDDFYELRHGWAELPMGGGKGLFLSGNNHSDDLFMGYYKELPGLKPGRLYEFHVTFRLATNVDGGMIGVGGSPGASVFVKGGVTTVRPRRTVDELGQYRLNIHKGNQAVGGCDLLVLGNLEKEETVRPGEYGWKAFSFTMLAKADAEGRVYLLLGTDSGFEATSSYYLDGITLAWEEQAERPITRAAAIQRMYDDARPAARQAPSFADVGGDHPCRDAIGWAEGAGLAAGYGSGRFGPEDSLTVEQAMVILHRYAGSPGADNGDADLSHVSPWARDSAAWGLQKGLIGEDDLAGSEPISEYAFVRAWREIQGEACVLFGPSPHR